MSGGAGNAFVYTIISPVREEELLARILSQRIANGQQCGARDVREQRLCIISSHGLVACIGVVAGCSRHHDSMIVSYPSSLSFFRGGKKEEDETGLKGGCMCDAERPQQQRQF